MNTANSNGKICYIEIPAIDVKQSSEFYKNAFGWKIRTREDGHLAFDDSTGEVSGAWVIGRKPACEPGFMIYIMVDSVAAKIETVLTCGGKLVQDIGGDAPEITARISDPAGNIVGLYQEPISTSFPEREIISTRVMDALPEQAFRAWSDPKILAQWWGPNGFTNTFHEFDPRPGGTWQFIMHGPDGKNYPNKNIFIEITKNKRVVFDHIFAPKFIMVISFDDVGGKTKFGFRMIFHTVEQCEQIKKIVVDANEQNFDRLQAVLALMK